MFSPRLKPDNVTLAKQVIQVMLIPEVLLTCDWTCESLHDFLTSYPKTLNQFCCLEQQAYKLHGLLAVEWLTPCHWQTAVHVSST